MSKQKSNSEDSTIILNRSARHEYTIEDKFEAGLVLLGWEVKSMRARKANLNDSYVIIKQGEAWLLGLHLTPLATTASYIKTDPTRTRKLLLHDREIKILIGKVKQKGYTIVPLRLYWKKGRAKLAIALAKGKQTHDKRASARDHDWARQKERLLKNKRLG